MSTKNKDIFNWQFRTKSTSKYFSRIYGEITFHQDDRIDQKERRHKIKEIATPTKETGEGDPQDEIGKARMTRLQ